MSDDLVLGHLREHLAGVESFGRSYITIQTRIARALLDRVDAQAKQLDDVRALHVPWFEIDGVRHDFTVIAYGSDVPADHVCRIGVEHQQCNVYPDAPEDSEHQVLACAECRQACEDYDVGHPFWPCATAAALAGDLPTDLPSTDPTSRSYIMDNEKQPMTAEPALRLECLRLAADHAPPEMEGPEIVKRAQRFIDLIEGKSPQAVTVTD